MKKILLGAVAAAAVTAFAAPAQAQVAGPRVEAFVGYDSVRATIAELPAVPDNTFGTAGIVFGIGLGYDMPLGTSAAIGIDVEASESNNDVNVTQGTTTAEIEVGRDLYAGARLSVLSSDAGTLYFKAGYTNLRVNGTLSDATVTETGSENLDGVRGGIGFQLNLGSSAYLGVEYRYSNYEADVTRHQGVGMIGFRF